MACRGDAGRDFRRVDLDEAVAAADLVIVLQHHRQYVADDVTARARLLLDTRGRYHGDGVHRL